MVPKTVAINHFTSRHKSGNKPNRKDSGAIQLRKSRFISVPSVGLAHLHPSTATRHAAVHLQRARAFLLRPFLSVLSLIPRGISHDPCHLR